MESGRERFFFKLFIKTEGHIANPHTASFRLLKLVDMDILYKIVQLLHTFKLPDSKLVRSSQEAVSLSSCFLGSRAF